MRGLSQRGGLFLLRVVTPPIVVAGFVVGFAFDRYIERRQEGTS